MNIARIIFLLISMLKNHKYRLGTYQGDKPPFHLIAVCTGIEFRVHDIEVFAVQMVLNDAERFTETGRLK